MSILLEYQFSVGGLSNVKQAFKSVEGYAAAAAKNEVRERDRVMRSAKPRAAQAAIDPELAAAKERAKAAASLDKQRTSALWRTSQEQMRADKRVHSERIRQFDRERRESVASDKARNRVRAATIGAATTGALRSVAGVGKVALAATGLAGGALAASRIGPGLDLEKAQRAIAIQGKQNGQASPLSYEQIRDRVSATAIGTGTSEQDVTAGFAKYVSKTGDVQGAADNLKSFATIASAAGASVEDVASAAAALSASMDIKSTQEMEEALSGIYYQGKKGAFELKDMSTHMSQLAATASALGMKGGGGIRTLGGLTQIAMTGAGDPAEAATAMKDAMLELVSKGEALESGKALGGKKVKVFTDKTKTKVGDFRNILSDTIAKGNLPQLESIFGRRGASLIHPLIGAAKDASAAAGGGKSGEAAARAKVLSMIEDASDAMGTFKDVQGDMTDAMKGGSAQLEIMNSKLQDAVSAKLIPALIALVPKLEPLIPKFGELLDIIARWIGYFAESPMTGIGIMVGGAIVKDIIAANIGPTVASTIVGAMAGIRGAQAAGAIGSGLAGLGGSAVAGGGALATAGAGMRGAAGGIGLGGAGLLAGAGIGAAVLSNDHMKEVSGGLGIFDLLGGALSGKGGFMAQIDAKQNEEARAAAKAQMDAAAAQKNAADALMKAAGSLQPGAPGATPNRGPDPTAPRI